MNDDAGSLSIRDGHQSYSGIAERQIRAMVLTGQIGPGERINELELSDAFEISRGPIREAIQRLATEGLLEMRPHRGAIVRRFDRRELGELIGMRIALETFAVREAAVRAPDGQLRVLATLLDQDNLIRAERSNTSSHPADERSLDFHRSLVLAAGNVMLLEAHASLMQKVTIAAQHVSGEGRAFDDATDEHQAIVGALLGRDGDAAAHLLDAHLRATLADLPPGEDDV